MRTSLKVTAVVALVIGAQALGASVATYTLHLNGDNAAYANYRAAWKAGSPILYTLPANSDADDQTVTAADVNWAVKVKLVGNSTAGLSPNKIPTGLANVVFDLELHQNAADGPLVQIGYSSSATTKGWYSSINDGTSNGTTNDPVANAAFCTSFNYLGKYYLGGTLTIAPTSGGPGMSQKSFPATKGLDGTGNGTNLASDQDALLGKLVGMGAGYPQVTNGGTGNAYQLGVGLLSQPTGYSCVRAGIWSEKAIAEGQIRTYGLASGTYVLVLKAGVTPQLPAGKGTNVVPGYSPSYPTCGSGVQRFAEAPDQVVEDSITFVYAAQQRQLTTSIVAGNGTLVPAPGNHNYDEGTVVTLTAAPESPCWRVKAWTGTDNDALTTNENHITMTDGDKVVSVEFEKIPVTLTTGVVSGNGTIDPAPGVYDHVCGDVVNLTAGPAAGFKVKAWVGTDNDTLKTNDNQVTMGAANKTVTVEFEEITYQLTTTVIGGNGHFTQPPTSPTTVAAGLTPVLVVEADPGYQVKAWGGDAVTQPNAGSTGNTVVMDGDKTVTVEFEPMCGPPAISTAYSVKTHVGETSADFSLDIKVPGVIESRIGGVTNAVVTFDRNIAQVSNTNADVAVTSGSVSNLTISGAQLTVEMSGAANMNPLVITFPGIRDAAGTGPECVVDAATKLCVQLLYGDANQDAAVNIFDLRDIRVALDLPVDQTNFLKDVNADNNINIFDLRDVRLNLDNTLVGGDCP